MATGSSEENPPPSKRTKDFLVFKRKETTEERFAVVEEKELEETSKGVVPKRITHGPSKILMNGLSLVILDHQMTQFLKISSLQ